MNRTLVILLTLSISANLGFVVRALHAPADGPQKPKVTQIMDRHLERMTEDLALHTGQQNALQQTHSALFPSLRTAYQNVEEQRDAVTRAFVEAADAPDMFRTRVHALQQARGRLDSLLTEVLLAEVAVLDSNQRIHYIAVSPWSRRYKKPPTGQGPPR
jgi:hypothetical protein